MQYWQYRKLILNLIGKVLSIGCYQLPIELLRALSNWAQMSLSQLRGASDRKEVFTKRIFFVESNPSAGAILLEPGAKIRFLLAQISDKYVKV